MIQLPSTSLHPDTLKQLADYQQEVDSCSSYKDQVNKAGALFSRRNSSSNPAFRVVRQTLRSMCQGARRCAYCEDAPADEVEHIRPKNIFPGDCFRWENYLYACGLCNGPKSDQFAVFHPETDQVFVVPPRWADDASAPPRGADVLINPRWENPMDFLLLDIVNGSFRFAALHDPGTMEYARAEFSCKILTLNNRDYLIQARQNAFKAFISMLAYYIQQRNAERPRAELDDIIKAIKMNNHQTVWLEMKRQRLHLDELNQHFTSAPEALEW